MQEQFTTKISKPDSVSEQQLYFSVFPTTPNNPYFSHENTGPMVHKLYNGNNTSSNHDLSSPQKQITLTNMASSYTPKTLNRKLDMAVLYGAPLVRKTSGVPLPLNDHVVFNQESADIKNMLQEQHKRISMRIDVASIRTLTDIITKQPVILHFICHGDWDNSAKKFFLAFENEYGELEACHSDRIRKQFCVKTEKVAFR